jgi:hypothetical protein
MTTPSERKRLFVCLACGKMSNDLDGEDPISNGWDESCMLNAALVYQDSINIENGRVLSLTRGDAIITPPLPPQQMPTFEEMLAEPVDPELLALCQEVIDFRSLNP